MKKYEINGLVYQLDDDDAARLGAVEVKAKVAANKAVTPKTKGAGDASDSTGGPKRGRPAAAAKRA